MTMRTGGGRPLRYGCRSTDEDPAAGVERLRALIAARERTPLRASGARPAAVLVPIVAGRDGLELLCFERTHEVLEHKGEICLPGGSVEATDADAADAALREAEEELGIDRRSVDVLGMLDDVYTVVSNYVITPVVGFIASPPEVVIDQLEVARPLAVTIDELLARGAETYELRHPDGTWRSIYAYRIGNDRIWGATARIIHGMLALWFGVEDGSR